MDAHDLRALVAGLSPEQIVDLVDGLPEGAAEVLAQELGAVTEVLPSTPLAMAQHLVPGFVERDHLTYLSERLEAAVRDVEAGVSRRLVVSLPPRSGKSLMTTQVLPGWVLAHHPQWPVVLTSYDGTLATSWGRQVRRWAEAGRLGSNVSVAADNGAAGQWETTEGGSVTSRSRREPLSGYGAKVLVIDDPHKDWLDAHSKVSRDEVWNWWTSVVQTRLEGPTLVVVIHTRWHEDDLTGRLLSRAYPGDPEDWEVISLPAVAVSEGDVLGREIGEPLLSPLEVEGPEEARERWAKVRREVGEYTFSALYQQSPSPATGSIFDMDSIRYWTDDPALESEERGVRYVSPEELAQGRWVDSWDMAFKGTEASDYVVGQRWCRTGPYRILVAQKRGRWGFTESLAQVKSWTHGRGPYGDRVHQRLVEDKANGTAIIDTLKDEVSGMKAVEPKGSKEARARSITPEWESGHVLLPLPSVEGNEWVRELVSELREFPNGANDDQVDALTQALSEIRDTGRGGVTVPGRAVSSMLAADRHDSRSLIRAAQGDGLRRMGSDRSSRRIPGR